MNFDQSVQQSEQPQKYTPDEDVARHEAGHFIVMVYLLVDNLPLITKVELIDDNTDGIVEFPIPHVKNSLYICLAGYATELRILNGCYNSLLTIQIPFIDDDLDKYLNIYDKINGVNLRWGWDNDETREIIIKDLDYTVELCKKLDNHINAFAKLLLKERIIEGDSLAKQIKFYSEKYLLKDFS